MLLNHLWRFFLFEIFVEFFFSNGNGTFISLPKMTYIFERFLYFNLHFDANSRLVTESSERLLANQNRVLKYV